jgi:uroporphyrinogen decarboxylase
MKPRERFLLALSRKQPDKVPICELVIDKPIIRRMSELLGIRPGLNAKEGRPSGERSEAHGRTDYVEVYCDVVERLDLDAVFYPFSYGLRRISEDKARDKFGRVYRLSPHGEPLPAEPLVRDLSDAERFDMASQLDPEDFADLRYIVERFGKTRACCMPINDPYKESWRTAGGMQSLLLYFRTNPELVHRLLRATTDFVLKAIDIAAEAGIDAFFMAGDFAHETGLFFSLNDYQEYFRDLYKEIVDHVHSRGRMIAKHSDGNVWQLLDEWMEAGFDGFHPIQPQCMDIKEVKEYVGKKMALIGNIDCRELLVMGSEEEVKEKVKETIEVAAPGGGYIISSSNSIHPGCKPENYIAMVEAANQYGAVY